MATETIGEKPNSRPLTPGEVVLARGMFGDAIDYAAARLARQRWAFFQPCGTVMAPMGTIHFHPADPNWREDFADAPLPLQHLFVHEMTHVWQAQTRGRWWLPLMRHPFCRYHYRLVPGRRFDRYGIEQQAEIVADTFVARHGVEKIAGPRREQLEQLLPFAPAATG